MIPHGDSASAPVHHSGFGAVPADADSHPAGGRDRAGISGFGRSARARRCDALPADASRLPAGTRSLPRRAAGRCRDPAAHPGDRRRRRGRAHLRRSGDRSARRPVARIAAGARATRPPAAAHASGAGMGKGAGRARRGRRAAGRPFARRRAGARRRSRPSHRRHDDAQGAVARARQARSRALRRVLAADVEIPQDRPRSMARRFSPNAARSRRRSAATA